MSPPFTAPEGFSGLACKATPTTVLSACDRLVGLGEDGETEA